MGWWAAAGSAGCLAIALGARSLGAPVSLSSGETRLVLDHLTGPTVEGLRVTVYSPFVPRWVSLAL